MSDALVSILLSKQYISFYHVGGGMQHRPSTSGHDELHMYSVLHIYSVYNKASKLGHRTCAVLRRRSFTCKRSPPSGSVAAEYPRAPLNILSIQTRLAASLNDEPRVVNSCYCVIFAFQPDNQQTPPILMARPDDHWHLLFFISPPSALMPRPSPSASSLPPWPPSRSPLHRGCRRRCAWLRPMPRWPV